MTAPPESLPSRVQRQQAALLAIGSNWRNYEADPEGAVRVITETAVAAVDVERVSVWLFAADRTKIVCEDLFERTPARHSRGTELLAVDYPRYFAALRSEEVIAAFDARSDPRTSEFTRAYLAPLGIGAMLDAPIRLGGRNVGVLCHEHVGGQREFPVDEQNTARYLASLVSLSLEHARRIQNERQLAQSFSLLRAAFDATGEGILAVDGRGRVIAHNQRFVEIWGVPKELLEAESDVGERIAYLADQCSAPDDFVARTDQLAAQSTDGDHVDLFELRDGRWIERSSRPQWVGGEVSGRVWSYRDVTQTRRVEAQLRASEERLRELASRDALTGLFNRRFMQQRFCDEIDRARRSARPFSVAMLDLDHFKGINDRHGHQTGDEVLRAFADDISKRVRKTDCVGRWGGEEFVLLLPETPRSAALGVVEEVREHIGRERDALPRFTVSAGVAEFPADGAELLPLIAAADARLYEAKHAGRNCVR